MKDEALIVCKYKGIIGVIELPEEKEEGINAQAEDFFVINKKSTLKIREQPSAPNNTNIIKELPPGKAVKVVIPKNEITKEGIQWIQVYADESMTEKGWANITNIYPDRPIETLFLNHPTIDFRTIKGEFNGQIQTLNYIDVWGRPGEGKYAKGQQKDSNGRFKVAVAPKILYPEYPDNGPVQADNFVAFNKNITVYLKHKYGGNDLQLPCVVADYKAHSYNKYPDGHNNPVLPNGTVGNVDVPNGLIQTGIAYPNSTSVLYH